MENGPHKVNTPSSQKVNTYINTKVMEVGVPRGHWLPYFTPLSLKIPLCYNTHCKETSVILLS